MPQFSEWSFPPVPRWGRRAFTAVLWLACLGAAAERFDHARTQFANPPDAPPDRRRADGNHGHAEIDFGGQWVFGRMAATGHLRELYDRNRQREVVRAAYPEAAESPYVRQNAVPTHLQRTDGWSDTMHDADALMHWFMGKDVPQWRVAAPAVTAPFAVDAVCPTPWATVALSAASLDRLTPDVLVGGEPAVGGPLYPPVHAFLYAPLAAANRPQDAYFALQVLSLGLTFVAGAGVTAISRGRVPWPVATTAVFLYPGYRAGLDLGQNHVLTLAVLVWGWALLVRGRAGWGGLVWGLLAFKPTWAAAFFLVPLLMRQWRFCLAMALTGLALGAATLPFTGLQPWFDWLAVGRMASWYYTASENWIHLSRDLSGLVRRVMVDFTLPVPERGNPTADWVARALWSAVFVTTVGLYLGFARRRTPTGPAAGFLALGAFLCCYHFMYYDVLQSLLPLAILFADPARLLRPAAVAVRTPSGREHTGVLNSVPLTVLAALLLLENWLLGVSVEVTARVGMYAAPTTAADGTTALHAPGIVTATNVNYAWDTLILLGLWAWCGWRLVADRDARPDPSPDAVPVS